MQKQRLDLTKKQATKTDNESKPHWTQCPKCRKIRAIIIWGIIVALIYFNFYV